MAPVVQNVTVTVADGRFWYSLGNGLGNGLDNSWYLDGNNASVVSSDGNKTTVQYKLLLNIDILLVRVDLSLNYMLEIIVRAVSNLEF